MPVAVVPGSTEIVCNEAAAAASVFPSAGVCQASAAKGAIQRTSPAGRGVICRQSTAARATGTSMSRRGRGPETAQARAAVAIAASRANRAHVDVPPRATGPSTAAAERHATASNSPTVPRDSGD